ncbi:hypothetical protein M8J77_003015 [Diaphorina citri]|nr:hypothetical protein M8J77_003015 [Diaphorina citri]
MVMVKALDDFSLKGFLGEGEDEEKEEKEEDQEEKKTKMPRVYERTSVKMSYSQEDLQQAMDCVRVEMKPVREAARRFGIPESTLRKKLLQNSTEVRMGRPPTFAPSVEADLASYIITLAKTFFGLTPKKLRSYPPMRTVTQPLRTITRSDIKF